MNGFIQDVALAYERAADYYRAKQQMKTARHYTLNGIQSMQAWGAETITRRWESDYQVNRQPKSQRRQS
ncbi:hypothetical protein, partial [Lysinibacillus fusiformis]|uniref:hypothetical protein n=1 Tax=Lysinibacillus fusiformis TaxID=28031 RepID=UPI0020BE8FAA